MVSGEEKKKVGKKFKAVLQVLTSHEIPQRARVCCLGRGGEDATTGITASLLHPKAISWGTDQSDHRPEIFHVHSQVTHRDPLCLLLSWGLQGCFPPKTLGFVWPPWAPFPCATGWRSWCGLAGYGVTSRSSSGFLERRGGCEGLARSVDRAFLVPLSEQECT